MQGWPYRYTPATIDHINLPGQIESVASRYNTRDYAGKLTSADRLKLNEVDLYPFNF